MKRNLFFELIFDVPYSSVLIMCVLELYNLTVMGKSLQFGIFVVAL